MLREKGETEKRRWKMKKSPDLHWLLLGLLLSLSAVFVAIPPVSLLLPHWLRVPVTIPVPLFLSVPVSVPAAITAVFVTAAIFIFHSATFCIPPLTVIFHLLFRPKQLNSGCVTWVQQGTIILHFMFRAKQLNRGCVRWVLQGTKISSFILCSEPNS